MNSETDYKVIPVLSSVIRKKEKEFRIHFNLENFHMSGMKIAKFLCVEISKETLPSITVFYKFCCSEFYIKL